VASAPAAAFILGARSGVLAFLGIMDQFSLPCASHAVSKPAALAQELITFGSVNSPEQLSTPSKIYHPYCVL